VKTDVADVPVPQTAAEANAFVLRIGRVQREITRRETIMNDELAALAAKHARVPARLQEAKERLKKGLQIWAAANRKELTSAGKVKFHDFDAGRIQWRTNPASVALKKVERVMASLKELKLDRFIRIKEEPNKEAMLEEPEVAKTVPGVKIKQDEKFVIVPNETKLEEVL
jgi:phage host-nuclease inhibitor protein Gam